MDLDRGNTYYGHNPASHDSAAYISSSTACTGSCGPAVKGPKTTTKAILIMDRSAHDFEYHWERFNGVIVRALTNRLYQQERQRIMEAREAWIKIISLVAGSAVFAKVSPAEALPWVGLLVAASAACSLVFGFGAKARDAAKRATEWAMLDRDIQSVGPADFTPSDVNAWIARCSELEAGEPAPNSTLLQRSYERACTAVGSEPSKKTTWRERFIPPIMVP